jgi:chorismate lyase / 3-hydroxybenzoate synthase
LLEEANRIVGGPRYSPEGLNLKVYVRNPTDLPDIQATLSQLLRRATGIVYLQADVCREDLLVEIEAVG